MERELPDGTDLYGNFTTEWSIAAMLISINDDGQRAPNTLFLKGQDH